MFDSSNERARQSAQTLILIFGIWKILFFREKVMSNSTAPPATMSRKSASSDIEVPLVHPLVRIKVVRIPFHLANVSPNNLDQAYKENVKKVSED